MSEVRRRVCVRGWTRGGRVVGLVAAATALAVVVGGCGGHSAAPDARAADAAVGVDAPLWSCEPHPPPWPAPSQETPTVVFDTQLPVSDTDFGAGVATFVDGDRIVVAGARRVHVLTLDGALLSTVSLDLSTEPPSSLHLVDATIGAGTLWVVMQSDGNDKAWFCPVDYATGIDAARCASLPVYVAGGGTPNLVADGSGFAVFSISSTDGAVTRWRFDATGTLIETLPLWSDVDTSLYVLHGTGTPDGMLLVTMGDGPGVYLHRLSASGRTTERVWAMPGLVDSGAGGFRLHEWAETLPTVLGQLTTMRCPDAADDDLSRVMTVLRRFDVASGAISMVPLAMSFRPAVELILDGEDAAVVSSAGLYSMSLSRFSPSGEATVSEMVLPLSYQQTGIEVQFVGAGRAIGPGDYVFVYGGTGGIVDLRVARIRLPASAARN